MPSDVLVVLDEAYREFVTDADVPDGLETYGDRPNVVVLRTLSKAWGLAGLRVGYLVAQPEVAAAVRKVVTPFSTSLVAQAAALAALDAGGRGQAPLRAGGRPSASGSPRRCASCPGRADQPGQLRLAAAGRPGRGVRRGLREPRRHRARRSAGDGVRVTIGTPEENDAFLAAAEAALT